MKILVVLLLLFPATPDQEVETKYVSAESGLRMRDSPNLTGQKVTTIPYNEEVTVLETVGEIVFLAGTYGKWTKVDYSGNTGWVFGGFLSDVKIVENMADKALSEDFVNFYLDQVGMAPALCRVDFEGYGYHQNEDGTIAPGTINAETGELEFWEYNLDFTYHFENGVSVSKNEGYEWGGTDYKFSAEHFELKDVFALAARIYRGKYSEYLSVIDGVPQLPTERQYFSRLDEYVEKRFKVEVLFSGDLSSLLIEENEGCGESWYFKKDGLLYVFGNNGGC